VYAETQADAQAPLLDVAQPEKESLRMADGEESLSDKVANAGDDIRDALGNAGDEINRHRDDMDDRPL
jgi:hypothetical protein